MFVIIKLISKIISLLYLEIQFVLLHLLQKYYVDELLEEVFSYF